MILGRRSRGVKGGEKMGIKKVGRLYDGRRDRPVAWWQMECRDTREPEGRMSGRRWRVEGTNERFAPKLHGEEPTKQPDRIRPAPNVSKPAI